MDLAFLVVLFTLGHAHAGFDTYLFILVINFFRCNTCYSCNVVNQIFSLGFCRRLSISVFVLEDLAMRSDSGRIQIGVLFYFCFFLCFLVRILCYLFLF